MAPMTVVRRRHPRLRVERTTMGQRTAVPERTELPSWGWGWAAAEDHHRRTAVRCQEPVTADRYLAGSCPVRCLERTPAGCPGLIPFLPVCPRCYPALDPAAAAAGCPAAAAAALDHTVIPAAAAAAGLERMRRGPGRTRARRRKGPGWESTGRMRGCWPPRRTGLALRRPTTEVPGQVADTTAPCPRLHVPGCRLG